MRAMICRFTCAIWPSGIGTESDSQVSHRGINIDDRIPYYVVAYGVRQDSRLSMHSALSDQI